MNSFEALKIMSEENKDIRMSPHFIGAHSVKQGGVVEMGVEQKTLLDLTINKHKLRVCLLIFDGDQFDEINKRTTLPVTPVDLEKEFDNYKFTKISEGEDFYINTSEVRDFFFNRKLNGK